MRCAGKALSPFCTVIYDNWTFGSLFPSCKFATCCCTWLWLLIWPNSHLYGTNTWHKTTNYTSLRSLILTLCQGLGATYTNHMKGHLIPQDKRVKDNVWKSQSKLVFYLPCEKGRSWWPKLCKPFVLVNLIPMDFLALPSYESSAIIMLHWKEYVTPS